MNRFVLKILRHLLLVISLLGIYILFFDVIFNIHSKENLFNENLDSTKIIITGSSHTLWGFDPSLFELNTINISEINKPTKIDIEIVKKYHEKIPNLEYVIIPVDYFTMFYKGDRDEYAKRYWYHWGLKHYFHFIDCKIATPTDLLVSDKPELSNFWPLKGVYNSLNDRGNMLKRVDAWHDHWMNINDHKEILDDLEEFTRFCEVKNIKIIFVQMPIPLSTQEYFNSKYTLITKQSLDQLKRHSNTYLIDFNDFSVFKNDSLFSDPDHLNYQGAKIASSLLNNYILTISSKSNQDNKGSNRSPLE